MFVYAVSSQTRSRSSLSSLVMGVIQRHGAEQWMRVECCLIALLDILSMRGRGHVGNGEGDKGW